MAYIYGKKYTKSELLKRVGDISQIAQIKRYKLTEGNESQVEAIDINTGTGFSFTVLPGRGMDISYAQYCGKPLCWRSSTGDVNPSFFDSHKYEWLRNFFGGLLTTCGLTYAGHPCTDEGEELGLHGRINNIPAKNVYSDGEWDKDEYTLFAQGKVRETKVFGEDLCLTRKITAKLGETTLHIKDIVENLGTTKTPHMILYHINGGFPVIDKDSILISPTKIAHPRDDEAKKNAQEYNKFMEPISGYKEKCYYHEMIPDKNGYVYTALANKKLGFGFYIKYSISELPNFIEWKMTGEGLYVVGIEPANCCISTRANLRKEGKLPFLAAGEKKEYNIEIGVLKSNDEIKELEKKVNRIKGER